MSERGDTEHEALALAHKIKSYWEARGKSVKVWTEAIRVRGSTKEHPNLTYIIRSNMINGKPQS